MPRFVFLHLPKSLPDSCVRLLRSWKLEFLSPKCFGRFGRPSLHSHSHWCPSTAGRDGAIYPQELFLQITLGWRVAHTWCGDSPCVPVPGVVLFCSCQKSNILFSFFRDRFLWKRWMFKNNLVVTGPNVFCINKLFFWKYIVFICSPRCLFLNTNWKNKSYLSFETIYMLNKYTLNQNKLF